MSHAKRRLAAILCADAVGYSRLMEEDEDGTLDRLRGCRGAIADLVAARDGRIVNTWGDAVIVEFASVLEAVRCAVDIQTDLAARNARLPADARMAFRIGINLGDVMVEGDDIYGDGVNIAARLQQAAEPGGIVISGPVYDQVHAKLAMGFDPLGVKAVKNLSEPVETYRVRVGGANAPAGVSHGRRSRENRPPRARDERSVSAEEMADDAAMRPAGRGVRQLWSWYGRQSARIRTAVAGIGFFFLLNLFTGLDSLWFFWPSIPFFLMLLSPGRDRRRH